MKKFTLLLVMISVATLAYNQSSRRTTSANNDTERTKRSRTETYASNDNRTNRVNRTADTRPERSGYSTSRSNSHNRSHKHSRHSTTVKHVHYHRPNTYCRTSEYKLRVPTHVSIRWTPDMHRHYIRMYPTHRSWHYNYGSRIVSIPSYDARYHVGHVRNIYGRVTDAYYYHDTDEYILHIGRYYPNQHFTVVIPGYIARQHSRRPVDYYLQRDVHVTGLITSYEGEPEVLVKRNSQFRIY